MEGAVLMNVPLTVKLKFGTTWANMQNYYENVDAEFKEEKTKMMELPPLARAIFGKEGKDDACHL